jgi:hypothetical protein
MHVPSYTLAADEEPGYLDAALASETCFAHNPMVPTQISTLEMTRKTGGAAATLLEYWFLELD